MTEYYKRGTYPAWFMEDYHFYRDLDPLLYEGGDPIDSTNILKSGDVPGAT